VLTTAPVPTTPPPVVEPVAGDAPDPPRSRNVPIGAALLLLLTTGAGTVAVARSRG
jgi:hypothetical protein